jgi:hypothetical protein
MRRGFILVVSSLGVLGATGCENFSDALDQYCRTSAACDGGAGGVATGGGGTAGGSAVGGGSGGAAGGGGGTGSCNDGIRNGTETDVDCGGVCPQCGADAGCLLNSDCMTGFCHAAVKHCTGSACADGVKDGQETDVDCGGGGACDVCALYQKCGNAGDCSSDQCIDGICGPYLLEWSDEASLICSRVTGMAATLGARIYVGGATSSCPMTVVDPTSTVEWMDYFNPGAGWVEDPKVAISAREGGALLSTDAGNLYVLGGFNDSLTLAYNTVGYTQGQTVMLPQPPMISRRAYFASTALLDGRLFVAGGHPTDPALVQDAEKESETFTPTPAGNSGVWDAGPSLGAPRAGAAAAQALDGRIFVTGGVVQLAGAPPQPLASVLVFPPDGGLVQAFTPMPDARAFHGMVRGPDGRLYVAGGVLADAGVTDAMMAFEPRANLWLRGAPMMLQRKRHALVVGPDNRIYAIGGADQTGAATHLVKAYGPTLRLTPNPVSDGGSVTLSGQNYAPNTSFEVRLNGRVVATGVTQSNTFLPMTPRPQIQPSDAGLPDGTYEVLVTDAHSGYPARALLRVGP